MLARIFIAFIECVLEGDDWYKDGFEEGDSLEWIKFPLGVYQNTKEGAVISLVDLGLTRRYYSFRPMSYVSITNNVLAFNASDGKLEVGVDESKQFPSKPKMTD